MKFSPILLILLLGGCITAASYLPSVQSCQHVDYKRDYAIVNVSMICDTSKSGTVKE
jgi:hypothetical protein